MNKAGLFGGGWEDYLNAFNDAFDRHVAENMPPHPFGASADAIMTGYANGATILPWLPSRDAANTGAMVPLPFPNFVTSPDGPRIPQGSPQMTLLQLSESAQPNQFSGMDVGPLGQRSGPQFPQGDQGGSGSDSAAFLGRPGGLPLPQIGPAGEDADPVVQKRQRFIRLGQKGEMEAGESGGGYQTYGTPPDGEGQYGTAKTMQVITSASNALANGPQYTPFTIGNISLENGTAFPKHNGHRDGLNFDVRPATANGDGGRTTWESPNYDSAATQRIVDALRATGQVKNVFFNDPNIKGVTPLEKHDDHMHIQLLP